MKDIARLSFKGGGVILPAHTAYEREILVEHVEASTKRHGHILLDVLGRRWTIRRSEGTHPVCVSCSQWPDNLGYPGGTSGALSVVSSHAAPCTNAACELAPVDAHA